jgi:hypothetical protein
MTAATLMLKTEAAPPAIQDTLLTMDSAFQLTLSAKPLTLMEPVLAALLRMSNIMELVSPFRSWPTFCFTMLSAAPKSCRLYKLSKPRESDSDFIQ